MIMQKKGVTLVELLVVVTILIILAAFAIMYLRSQIFKGQDAKRKGDMHKIQVAIEEYEKDHNCYPLSQLVVCDPGTGLRPYISKIPCDPTTRTSYYYGYEDSTCPSWYQLYTSLEYESDENIMGNIGPMGNYNYCLTSPNAPECVVSGLPQVWGCFSGSCLSIDWDPSINQCECQPCFEDSDCADNQCVNRDTGESQNECNPVE